jgi:mRNA interferase RelE/StbE
VKYRVELENRARREFLDLSREARERISPAIDALQLNPRPPGARRLVGSIGYRVRRGDYRILYTIDDSTRVVRIYRIGHRRDVYRG